MAIVALILVAPPSSPSESGGEQTPVIDDEPSTRQSNLEGATNYVAQALDAAMAGEAVKPRSTKSCGCSVKY